MKFLLILVFVLLLAGCDTTLTGYPFQIEAVYRAPRSDFKVMINTEGRVPAGSDTSDSYKGVVSVQPYTKNSKKVTLQFNDHEETVYAIGASDTIVEQWGFRIRLDTLRKILLQAGYGDLDENELEETIRVIGGAFSGPKGVILKGQSKYLEVISVEPRL